jgi:hypothetical protein
VSRPYHARRLAFRVEEQRPDKRLAEWVAVFCDGRTDQHPLVNADTRLPPG